MIFITVILRELKTMSNTTSILQDTERSKGTGISRLIGNFALIKRFRSDDRIIHPFRVIVNKEISDHIRSWRFIILLALIALTCLGSVYTGLAGIGEKVKPGIRKILFSFCCYLQHQMAPCLHFLFL